MSGVTHFPPPRILPFSSTFPRSIERERDLVVFPRFPVPSRRSNPRQANPSAQNPSPGSGRSRSLSPPLSIAAGSLPSSPALAALSPADGALPPSIAAPLRRIGGTRWVSGLRAGVEIWERGGGGELGPGWLAGWP